MDLARFLAEQVPLKLLAAVILGGLVGLERELHGRPAGLRTHVLVCLGATILIVAAREAGALFGEAAGRLVMDPNRIAAGIVTGIGFLGAGAIIRTGDFIRGLTTGACIWFVAALGVVIGNGLYVLAASSTVLVLVVLEVFDKFEEHIPSVSYRLLRVVVPSDQREEFESWCCSFLRSEGARVQEVLRSVDSAAQTAEITFRIRARGDLKTGHIIGSISQRPEVKRVGWEQA